MNLRSFLVAAPIVALLANCSSQSSSEQANTVSAAFSFANLSIAPIPGPSGTLEPRVIKGTYGSHCKINAGHSWDLLLNSRDNSLQVALNDSVANCPLTLTAISMASGGRLIDYNLEAPIVLNRDYQETAARVDQPNPAKLAFYANAEIMGLSEGGTYSNNFVINLIYSDDALVCGATAPPAVYAKVTATSTGSGIAPPTYMMGFDGLQLLVDANNVVQEGSTGNVVLSLPAGGQAGEEWKIFSEAAFCCSWYTFAEIDEIYLSNKEMKTGAMAADGTVTLPWSSFDLLGRTLPRWRTVIVKHTGAGSVYSYELFQVMFPGARTSFPFPFPQ